MENYSVGRKWYFVCSRIARMPLYLSEMNRIGEQRNDQTRFEVEPASNVSKPKSLHSAISTQAAFTSSTRSLRRHAGWPRSCWKGHSSNGNPLLRVTLVRFGFDLGQTFSRQPPMSCCQVMTRFKNSAFWKPHCPYSTQWTKETAASWFHLRILFYWRWAPLLLAYLSVFLHLSTNAYDAF